MRLIFWVLLSVAFAAAANAAEPTCSAYQQKVAPNSPQCFETATDLQDTDIVYGVQGTGPTRSNQSVKIPISQLKDVAAGAAPVQSVAGRDGDVTLSTTDISGLGTIATQSAASVAVTGGTISGADVSGAVATATGSTTARTLADRFGDAVSLRDFGAACDGTTNDTTAFQVMRSALGSTSTPRTVIFPGNCVITAANYVISGALSFRGQGGGGIKLVGSDLTANVFQWNSASAAVSVIDMIVDVGGLGSATGINAVFLFSPGEQVTFRNNKITNGGTPATGTSFFLVAAYGITDSVFSGNLFAINTADSNSNEAINIGGTGVNNVQITDNILKKTGIGVFAGTNMLIAHNNITGWGYGGGITYEVNNATDTEDKNVVISNNVIQDSLTSLDINNTRIAGIEVGYNGVTIANNTIRGTCGVGIELFGRGKITGNRISNVGRCDSSTFYNSGIAVDNPSPGWMPAGANYSTIADNTVFDDGGGNTSYGFSDTSSSTGIVLGVNDFQGKMGAYNVSGGTTFAAPQADNRVVNPCFTFDQRNEATSLATGRTADQWQILQSVGRINFVRSSTRIGQCLNSMAATLTTSATPSSTDIHALRQSIGYNDVSDFGYATNTAKTAIVSFTVSTTATLPFTGSFYLKNFNSTYTYAKLFRVTKSPQTFSFRIPPDTHSLGSTGTNVAYRLGFDYGSGSTRTTAEGSWTSGDFYGAAGADAFVSQSVGTKWLVSDVRLLPAGVDLGWTPRPFADELRNVQRFYRKTFAQGTKPAQNAGLTGAACQSMGGVASLLTPPMWSAPTVTTYNPSAANANWRNTTAGSDTTVTVPSNGQSLGTLTILGAPPSAGDLLCLHYTLDAAL